MINIVVYSSLVIIKTRKKCRPCDQTSVSQMKKELINKKTEIRINDIFCNNY